VNKCSIKKLKQSKKYRENHKEQVKQLAKQYHNCPTGIYIIIKNNAKKRNIKINISKEDFINWYNSQKQECYYCKRTLSEIKKDKHYSKTQRLTIDRINNNKDYNLNNIVLACWICNSVKSKIFNKKEMLKLGSTLKGILK
jgi:5-methylcytosine-specific restriction endonuclease McrA